MLIDLINAVVDQLGDDVPAAKCYIGPEYLRQEHSPPRVVFVPTSGDIDPTMRIGETVAMATVNGGGRSLHTRKCGCDVHVWGDPTTQTDDDPLNAYRATEELMHSVLRALYAKGVGSRSVGAEEWNDTTLDVKYGREVVFKFMAFIPVPARASLVTSNSPPGDTKANITTTLGEATGCSGTGA